MRMLLLDGFAGEWRGGCGLTRLHSCSGKGGLLFQLPVHLRGNNALIQG